MKTAVHDICRTIMLCILLSGIFCQSLYAIDKPGPSASTPHPLPITSAFHNIGLNIFHALTHNYGAHFIGAGLGTWGFIKSGIDWSWRNTLYENNWLTHYGRPGLYIGYFMPVAAPVLAWSIGRLTDDIKLQITGMALFQSMLVTMAFQTPLKMLTGREMPGIITELDHAQSQRTDDFSGEFHWFSRNFIGGWPSAHTANAFAAAAAVSEIYRDALLLKIGMYTYAALIGFGVTLNVHWASDAFAGALIGYAIGKTVGKSFNALLHGKPRASPVSLYIIPNMIGVGVRL